jgi:hypothetical protein
VIDILYFDGTYGVDNRAYERRERQLPSERAATAAVTDIPWALLSSRDRSSV